MTSPTAKLAVAFATLVTLSACEPKPPEVVGGPVPDQTSIAAANQAPVTLPPAIRETRSYRCNNTRLVTINYLADDLTVNLRPTAKPTSPPIVLTAPAAGEPFVAEGYRLVGTGPNVTLTEPGFAGQECKS